MQWPRQSPLPPLSKTVMNHEIEYKDLIISRPFLFLGKCIVWAGMIIAGVVLVGMPVWWAQGAGMLLVAMAIAHGIELEHQALHATGIGKRWLDMTLRFVLGLPLLISPHHYQDRHLYHHQHVGTPKDSEFFQFSKVDNNRMLRFAINLLMLPHWAMVAKLLRASWTGGSMGHVYNKLNERRIRRDYRLFGVITIAAAALIAVFRPFDPVPLLAFPLAACIHTLVELPGRRHCMRSMRALPIESCTATAPIST